MNLFAKSNFDFINFDNAIGIRNVELSDFVKKIEVFSYKIYGQFHAKVPGKIFFQLWACALVPCYQINFAQIVILPNPLYKGLFTIMQNHFFSIC